MVEITKSTLDTNSDPDWVANTFQIKKVGAYTFLRDDQNQLAQELMGLVNSTHGTLANPFCLWLIGPLGAGKTTLTGALLKALGYPADLPVLSPTYTLMSDYPINLNGQTQWYAHLDLYRLGEQTPNLEDFGILDAHHYRGLFIEWPERALGDPSMAPTHLAFLDFGSSELERHLKLIQVLGPKPSP